MGKNLSIFCECLKVCDLDVTCLVNIWQSLCQRKVQKAAKLKPEPEVARNGCTSTEMKSDNSLHQALYKQIGETNTNLPCLILLTTLVKAVAAGEPAMLLTACSTVP
jgi:hypothetical protein